MNRNCINYLATGFFYFTSFSSLSRTVNIYLENKTSDSILVQHLYNITCVKPGVNELVGSQEREPAHWEGLHHKPDIAATDLSVFLFQLDEPITIRVITSSAQFNGYGFGKHFVKRDNLEWIVSHPSDTRSKVVSNLKSSSKYLIGHDGIVGKKNNYYVIRGEKKGADLHILPAADICFTIERITS